MEYPSFMHERSLTPYSENKIAPAGLKTVAYVRSPQVRGILPSPTIEYNVEHSTVTCQPQPPVPFDELMVDATFDFHRSLCFDDMLSKALSGVHTTVMYYGPSPHMTQDMVDQAITMYTSNHEVSVGLSATWTSSLTNSKGAAGQLYGDGAEAIPCPQEKPFLWPALEVPEDDVTVLMQEVEEALTTTPEYRFLRITLAHAHYAPLDIIIVNPWYRSGLAPTITGGRLYIPEPKGLEPEPKQAQLPASTELRVFGYTLFSTKPKAAAPASKPRGVAKEKRAKATTQWTTLPVAETDPEASTASKAVGNELEAVVAERQLAREIAELTEEQPVMLLVDVPLRTGGRHPQAGVRLAARLEDALF